MDRRVKIVGTVVVWLNALCWWSLCAMLVMRWR